MMTIEKQSNKANSADKTKRSSAFGLGPGLIVAAAFVGPGTVTTAARAGAEHGFGLVWVVLLSILGVIVLQEMAGRLGTLTGQGLGAILRRQIASRISMILLAALVIAAIGFGNAVIVLVVSLSLGRWFV